MQPASLRCMAIFAQGARQGRYHFQYTRARLVTNYDNGRPCNLLQGKIFYHWQHPIRTMHCMESVTMQVQQPHSNIAWINYISAAGTIFIQAVFRSDSSIYYHQKVGKHAFANVLPLHYFATYDILSNSCHINGIFEAIQNLQENINSQVLTKIPLDFLKVLARFATNRCHIIISQHTCLCCNNYVICHLAA